MRRYFIALFIVCSVSQPGFSQGLRRCGCKTWRAWNTSTPKEENEGSWKRKQNYEKYKHTTWFRVQGSRAGKPPSPLADSLLKRIKGVRKVWCDADTGRPAN